MHEAQVVFRVTFVPSEEASFALQSGKESFDLPRRRWRRSLRPSWILAFFLLRRCGAIISDVTGGELPVEWGAVVGFVADHARAGCQAVKRAARVAGTRATSAGLALVFAALNVPSHVALRKDQRRRVRAGPPPKFRARRTRRNAPERTHAW